MDIAKYYLSINQYDYSLPDARIAKYPLPHRDDSKLLIYNNKTISESIFHHLPDFLSPEDLMVFNDTKVIRARMLFEKATGAKIEIFCLEPVDPADYAQAFQQRGTSVWKCIVGNLKKWKGEILHHPLSSITLSAEKIADYATHQLIRFTWNNELTWGEVMDEMGVTPIPPYLNRESEPVDQQRYQTVYSKYKGSVAAPTAGLHFTDDILQQLKNKGVGRADVTLHVGAGTFKPVKVDNVVDHPMHAEYFTVSRDALTALIARQGHILAVGTTSMRTLESLYWLGVKIHQETRLAPDLVDVHDLHLKQFEAYDLQQTLTLYESLKGILAEMDKEGTTFIGAHTEIMIMPGYTFKLVDKLITNFHQPKSTLLLLVSAFVANDWESIYEYALSHDFRFLSYGDSSLLTRSES